MNVKLSKAKLLNLLTAILDSTGCFELCRLCSTTELGTPIMLDGVVYGRSFKGECCPTCDHLTDEGCDSPDNRSVGCTLFWCEILVARLKHWGLYNWWYKIRKAVVFPGGRAWDFKDPELYSLDTEYSISVEGLQSISHGVVYGGKDENN